METQKKRTTGWAVMEMLRGYGIDTVFGIPGTHNLEFYRPLTDLGIRAVTTRHEQGAGYAADGWSLQSGLPGVVLTTSGPGLLNALSAAGTAFCESRPMIILSPGQPRGARFADAGTLHETKDQLGAASAVVEWARRVTTVEEAIGSIHDAFELFATSRPRPVYIEIPLDLLDEVTEVDSSLLKPQTFDPVPPPGAEAIAEAARRLTTAASPTILAGGGARSAASEVRHLAERLGAPVVTTLNGKGVLDETHPLSLGSNLRLHSIREYARSADVLLVIGSKLGDAELWVDRLDATGSVIRVDILESQINKNQQAELGLVGEASAVIGALVQELGDGEASNPEPIVAELLNSAHDDCRKLSAQNTQLSEDIVSALPDDAILATDSSRIAYGGLLNVFSASRPNSTPYMGTFATLGYGLPAALGARIAAPERASFAVIGDGALMFSVQEFITVVEQDQDVTVVVVDNGGYGEIRQNEADLGIPPIGVDLLQPDWVGLAAAFGGAGTRVRTRAGLAAAMDSAMVAGGLQVIHIDVAEYTHEEDL
ncbi:thiamine pyrophosphate-binding protein [Rothia uropygioeca]|uniref:thiamine pyrophosphate-binding protein n=1 Tax=Kocuria sp. 257 TaxID=2021970 RepID=UPI00101012FC|nr:thiamine pyrophosphate-binding protein [Kocuria sp. 257]